MLYIGSLDILLRNAKVLKGKIKDWVEKGELKLGDEKTSEDSKDLPIISVILVASKFSGATTNQQRICKRRATIIKNVRAKNDLPQLIRGAKEVSFSDADTKDLDGPHDDALVISIPIGGFKVQRFLIDGGTIANIIF